MPISDTTLSRYSACLAKDGKNIVPGSAGTFWAQYESIAMMRMPDFVTDPPATSEIRRVLWAGPAAMATYLTEVDASHPANAWLYVCCDKHYKIEHLSVTGRRDARRARRSLNFEFVSWDQVLRDAFPLYRDSRQRVGLSDGTWKAFTHRMTAFSLNPSHFAVGAFKGGVLVALMTLIVVDDWVAIEGSFSMDNSRSLCPNDGLSNFVLNHYLVERNFRIVSYGLSSIQQREQGEGLHSYKLKVGFEAKPVHRAFILHPLVRPFANRLALGGITLAEKLFSGNRMVKKARGALVTLVKKTSVFGDNYRDCGAC